jgi:chromosomal replication initiator protein DnaA
MLVSEGVVSAGQLGEALKAQRENGKFLGQVLVEMNFITQSTLVSFLVKQCKIPHISLADYVVSDELFQLVPKELCLKYNLLPIDKLGRILTLAMVDPLDVGALEQVRRTCPDIKIKPILCDWNHFDTVVKRVFQTQEQQSHEVTAGSFGLAEQKPRPQPKAAPKPVEQSAVDAAVDALVKDAPGPNTEATSAQKSGVAAQRPSTPERPAPSPPAAPTISAEAVGAQVAESMRTVIHDALQPLVAAGARKMPEAADSKAIAAEVTAGIRNAMQDLVAPLVAEHQRAAEERMSGAQPVPDPSQWMGQLGQELQNAIRGGFESMLQAQRDEPKTESPVPDLTALIGESVRAAVSEQEARFLQVAESMLQAAQATEASLRAIQEEHTRDEGAENNSARIANLEVFPGKTPDELSAGQFSDAGALDSPGLGMEADERVREAIDSDRLLAGYTFKEFIVGPANTFTLKATRALGEKLARDFNPLYICGDEGLGKTHLLNAVGNAVLAKNPDLRVAYVSTSHFASAFSAALKHDELSELRDRYCRWDVLLIDDIQFLAGRMEAQEELFHIFNALVHEGRIVVIAGDRPPDKLTEFQKGLTSRFSSGIVTKLRPPEMEVRLAILKRFAEAHRVAVPEEILTLVATRIASDVRRMRGALRKVIAYAKLVEQEITREMANEVLDSLGAEDAA